MSAVEISEFIASVKLPRPGKPAGAESKGEVALKTDAGDKSEPLICAGAVGKIPFWVGLLANLKAAACKCCSKKFRGKAKLGAKLRLEAPIAAKLRDGFPETAGDRWDPPLGTLSGILRPLDMSLVVCERSLFKQNTNSAAQNQFLAIDFI